MKCFLLDEHGDVVIENNKIVIVRDRELIIQKIRQILLTNRGEWWLDTSEGLGQRDIFRKSPHFGLIRDQIKLAVHRVDESLTVSSIEISEDRERRHLDIRINIDGEILELEV